MSDSPFASALCALHHLLANGRDRYLLPTLVLLPTLLLMLGCKENGSHSPAPPHAVRSMVAAQPDNHATAIWTGEIRAHDEVALGFRLGGRLLSRTVDVGDRIQAGQQLAAIESETSEHQLSSARAELTSAQAAEQVAALTLKRMQHLLPSGAIARAQVDTAQADWQAAVAQRQAKADTLKTAQDTLRWTRLLAPQDGVITQTNASGGQVVSAGQTIVTLAVNRARDAVFDVVDPTRLAADASSPFAITLLADPHIQVQGHLRDISPQADVQTRTWRVRIALDDALPALALGATVQIQQQVATQAMIAVPATALARAGDQPALWVVNPHTSRLQLHPVVLGKFTTDTLFITRGIAPGDRIVTAGVSQLREGERVSLEAQP